MDTRGINMDPRKPYIKTFCSLSDIEMSIEASIIETIIFLRKKYQHKSCTFVIVVPYQQNMVSLVLSDQNKYSIDQQDIS